MPFEGGVVTSRKNSFHITSNADSEPPSDASMCLSSDVTSENFVQPTSAVWVLRGTSRSRSTRRVTIPSVPSLPMNSCFRS